jgi:N-acetylglucosaminyl-diphospho-decaprenol L-rhamnosyltransferase
MAGTDLDAVDLSIIIVTWRSLDYVRRCLSSIYRETRELSFEVIVVDNASGDRCEGAIRKEFPRVKFHQSAENLGFSKANNLGYVRSSGDILLFLNPDTEVRDNVFARMTGYLHTHPGVAAVGARLLNSDGTLQTSCVQTYPTICNQVFDAEVLRRRFPGWSIWGIRGIRAGISATTAVQVISGACFMVRKVAFHNVGLFSEAYFMYAEDLDLSYRLNAKGYAIHYLPGCEVVHHGGKSSAKREPEFVTVRQRDAMLEYFRRTKGLGYANCYRAVLGAVAVLRIGLVVFSLPFGSIVFRGKSRSLIFRKWATAFVWAVGADRSLANEEGRAGP